jgi:hypothetical protein
MISSAVFSTLNEARMGYERTVTGLSSRTQRCTASRASCRSDTVLIIKMMEIYMILTLSEIGALHPFLTTFLAGGPLCFLFFPFPSAALASFLALIFFVLTRHA